MNIQLKHDKWGPLSLICFVVLPFFAGVFLVWHEYILGSGLMIFGILMDLVL